MPLKDFEFPFEQSGALLGDLDLQSSMNRASRSGSLLPRSTDSSTPMLAMCTADNIPIIICSAHSHACGQNLKQCTLAYMLLNDNLHATLQTHVAYAYTGILQTMATDTNKGNSGHLPLTQ